LQHVSVILSHHYGTVDGLVIFRT